MTFYRRRILPRLIDLVMGSQTTMPDRAKYVGLASGTVVEIGVGSGHNLRFYGPSVSKVIGVDPSVELWQLACRRLDDVPCPVEFIAASAEDMSIENATADTVVTTWSLCSIPNPERAVREMRRVLKPAGRLVFVEHGAAPDPRVRRWQNRLTPLWRRAAGGCHLNRPIDTLVAAGGFRLLDLERGYGAGPKPFDYLYKGVATPDDRRTEA